MRTSTLSLFLCLILMVNVNGSPIGYQQIDQQAQQKTNNGNPAPTQAVGSEQTPEFVRLTDGRIVPFGVGVVCSDNCVGAEAFDLGKIATPKGFNPWLLSIPIAAGGVAAIFLLSGGNGGTTPTTIVTDTLQIIVPPRDPVPAPVPEPATLALMGAGLAMLARHSKKKRK